MITDIPGILVGHAQNEEALTGCTAILFEGGDVCSVDVRGSSPGTRETSRSGDGVWGQFSSIRRTFRGR
ncbi:P1 family peptidase [Paenibacillus larvae]|uniref:P1 family peptidase n=1 Tax=Paenibacillus larvae TaxID=1464 RepID=UPI002E157132